MSLTGVTGARLDPADSQLHAYLGDLRGRARCPVAVGFGVREPAHVRALAPHVGAVVVGSAFVRAGLEGPEALAERVRLLRPPG